MNSSPPADLSFFSVLVAAGSLSAAGRELNLTTAAVSKRLSQLEARLGVALLHRTTRRMSLTVEGEHLVREGRAILAQIDALHAGLRDSDGALRGLLRVNATLGFGRAHVAPLIATFAALHPQLEIRLQLSVDPPPLTDDAFDVCIRFGPPPDARIIARKLATNQRILCAAPAYLKRAGTPTTLAELALHNLIAIRQGEGAYGRLQLAASGAQRFQNVRVESRLATNDGGIAVDWALAGLGLVLRAQWDVERYVASGRLVQILPDFHSPDANIYAVYPSNIRANKRISVFIDYLEKELERREK